MLSELIDDIITKTGIEKEARLLEIGAGTGKATISFAEQGYSIYANEIGWDMAEILRDKCLTYPKVLIDVLPFEEWKAPDHRKFDLIYCAQAFHWIDKDIKYKKCHELLKDHGHLALFWYHPDSEKLPFAQTIDDEVKQIVDRYITEGPKDKGAPERRAHDGVTDHDERQAEIVESGLFDLKEKLEYTQMVRNTPRQYLMAMKSVPAFASLLDRLDEEQICSMDHEITKVINRYGGYTVTKFHFTLYLARKK